MNHPIIDYLSFSVPTPCLIDQWEAADRLDMGNLFDERTDDLLHLFASQSNWRHFPKSGLFNEMIRFDDIGMTYMQGHKCQVSLVQFSGQGCQFLRDNNLLEGVLHAWLDRITRIDIALDFQSSADPEDVARSISNQRFKTDSHEKSNTGTTWYVGSYKSDRFARVYRYTDELARGNTLRIEYQFSDGQARHAAASCLDEGILSVASKLHNLYGWKHPDCAMEYGNSKFQSAPRPKTRAGKELWLKKQVIPSLIKEAMNGNVEFLIELKDHLCAIIDEYISV